MNRKKSSCPSLTQTHISQNNPNRHIPPLKYLPVSLNISSKTELYWFPGLLC